MSILENIEQFEVSCNGNKQLFLHKLVRESGWSMPFAKAAFLEYKRFIYLAFISDFRVVPSRTVDEVWHLHMTFTRSYWHDLCGDVLGREIHHTPSSFDSTPTAEDLKDYAKTQRLYVTEFGDLPPTEFWGQVEKTNNKIAKKRPGVVDALFLTIFSVLFLAACSEVVDEDVAFFLKCALAAYVIYKVLRWVGPGNGGKGGGSSCSSCSSCGGD